jgi:hypothetical protein
MKRMVVDLNEEENDLLWEMIDFYLEKCKETQDYVSVDILEDLQEKISENTFEHDI